MANNTINFENNPYSKEFSTLFNSLSLKYDKTRVWNDFIVMVACAISNASDKRFYNEREEQYLEITKKYTKDDLNKFGEMFAYLVQSLDEKTDQDFLGTMVTMFGLNNKNKGQFFTPYELSALLASFKFVDSKSKITNKKFFSVADDCCGSGSCLIAFANEARRNNINYQRQIMFVAQDIDYIVGLMCYIQLSLLGCKLLLKIGDTLTDPFTDKDMGSESVWISPMYTYEKRFEMLDVLERAEKLLSSPPVETEDNNEEKTA